MFQNGLVIDKFGLSFVIWITGFSGAGKTTVAKLLQKKLEEQKIKAILLDGDEVREVLGLNVQYSYEERKKIAYKYARLAKLISDQGFVVVVATISMFEEVREWNRKNNNNYFEVYLRVSDEERRKRDPKKLYLSKQEMVDSIQSYEEPQNPDIVFDFEHGLSPVEIAAAIQKNILNFLKEKI